MNKKRLKEFKSLMKEAEHLEEQIKNMPLEFGGYVADSAKDYRTGYPKSITITGYSTERYDRLRRKLQDKLRRIQDEIHEIEDWLDGVEDPQTRDIVRLLYINGMSQEEVAEELGYSRSAIAMKLQRFWEENMERKKHERIDNF